MMRETLFRSEFNKFLNSKEGKHYYQGVLPVKKKQSNAVISKKL